MSSIITVTITIKTDEPQQFEQNPMTSELIDDRSLIINVGDGQLLRILYSLRDDYAPPKHDRALVVVRETKIEP